MSVGAFNIASSSEPWKRFEFLKTPESCKVPGYPLEIDRNTKSPATTAYVLILHRCFLLK